MVTLPPERRRRFLLIGGGRPLATFAAGLLERGREVLVVSSPARLAADGGGAPLADVLDRLGVPHVSHTKLTADDLAAHVDDGTTAVSFSAPWIFRQGHIDALGGALLNLHSAPLPRHRGAGGDTWQILMGRSVGGFTLHVVDTGIDTGPILLQRTFAYPGLVPTLTERHAFAAPLEAEFITAMLDLLCGPDALTATPQDHGESTYWPRLDTRTNGFIDWSWNADEILAFVRAFDDPYPGAGTFVGDRELRLKGCTYADNWEFHPFQSGLVYRFHDGLTYVAAREGGLAFAHVLDGKTGEPVTDLRIGTRLFTPRDVLERAWATRARYGPLGRKP